MCLKPKFYVLILISLIGILLEIPSLLSDEINNKPEIMNLCLPADSSWDKLLPQPKIPAPPKNVGLLDSSKLSSSEPIVFKSTEELTKEAAKPEGKVKGNGTVDSPYVIKNLAIRDLTNIPGILIENVKAPLVIKNVLIDGKPVSQFTPSKAFGIRVVNCENVIIRRCQVSRCHGISGYGDNLKKLLVENCFVFSCRRSIATGKGSHCTARSNLVVDSKEFGIFLYNGTDHIIENNYISWSGREGIGTNGNSARQTYRNNIIHHASWTAINCEGETHDSVVEGNLVVDTHYGIILMGNRTVCRDNRVFYSSQMGISVYSNKNHPNEGMQVLDNLIVATGADGINVMPFTKGAVIRNNRIWQSHTAINASGPNFVIESNDIYRFFQAIKISASAWADNPMYKGAKDERPGTIAGNHIYSGRNGIRLDDSAHVKVTDSRIHHTVYGISTNKSSNLLLANNQMTSVNVCSFANTNGKRIDIRNNQITHTGYGAVSLNDCTDSTVENNDFHNIGLSGAVQLRGGSNHLIKGNTMANVLGGLGYKIGAITIEGTNNCSIEGNTIENAPVGVYFADTPSRGRKGKNALGKNNVLKGNSYKNNKINISTPKDIKQFGNSNQFDEVEKTRTK